jgi:hypothetical protein
MMPAHVWWTLAALAAVGGWGLWRAARTGSRTRALGRLLVAAFAVRLAIGVALYLISANGWPVLPELHYHQGFWLFGPDAYGYHHYAQAVIRSLTYGIEWPQPGMPIDYYLVVAGVYTLFGAHPLYGIGFNGWLGAAAGLVAYSIGRRLYGPRAALTAAALVALWPSSLLWSGQLLKDSLGCVLILGTVAAVVALVSGAPRGARRVVYWTTLILCLTGLTRLRPYAGVLMAVAAGTTFGGFAMRSCVQRRWRRGAGDAALAGAVVLVMLWARGLDLSALLAPRDPEAGRVRLARLEQDRGNAPAAIQSYQIAMELNRRYAPAYWGLAELMVRRLELDVAFTVLGRCVEGVEPSNERDLAISLLVDAARLWPAVVRMWEVEDRWVAVEPTVTSPEVYAAMHRELREKQAAALALQQALLERLAPLTGGQVAVAQRSVGLLSEQPEGTPSEALRFLAHSVGSMDEQAVLTAQAMRPESLGNLRQGFITTGGYSLMDPWAMFANPRELLAYLPRALAIGLLAPFPWQWFDTKGSTGVVRGFASVEMLLLYLLLPGLGAGAAQLLRRRDRGGLFVLALVVCSAAALSLVVANLGTLFRLRLQFVFPMLVLAAGGDPVGWWRRRLGARARRGPAEALRHELDVAAPSEVSV